MAVQHESESRPLLCPTAIVKEILDNPPEGLAPYAGIRYAPCLRADGTLSEEQGYDPLTHYYSIMPELEEMSQAQAIANLDEILCEFPFATPADRTALFAALLTPLIRPAVDNVPLALLNKPMPRTGATLLAEVVIRICTGSGPCPYADG